MDETVVLDFMARVEEAVTEIKRLAGEAAELAAAEREAKARLDEARDAAAATAAANSAAAMTTAEIRDRLTETAAAAGIYRDETGKLRDAQDRVVSSSVLEGLALGHTRDEALAAAEAFKRLRDAEAEAVAVKDAGFLGSLGNLAGNIPMGSGMMSLPALLAIVPAVEALLPLVVALVSGFAAAGAGAAGFALLAMPAFKSVSSAYQQIQSDQQAYDRALTATARNNALKHLQEDYAGLSGPQKEALGGIQQLTGEWHKLSDAFTPEAMKVFTGFLTLANQLLPDITPFAKTFADALSGLLGKASSFAGSQGFKDWLNQFHALEGPAITAIGDGIGKVAVAVGKLLTVMSAKDVVNAINIAFTILAGTIDVVTYMVKRLMDNWDGMSVAARHVAYDVQRWAADTAQAFDLVRHTVASWGHDTAVVFDTVRHTAATAGHDVAHAFDVVRHDIVAALDAVISFVQRNWRNILAWLVVPVLAAVYEIRTHTHEIAQEFDKLRHDAASILDGMRHDVSATFDRLRHDVAAIVVGIPGDVRKAWDAVRHDAAAAGDALLHAVTSVFTSLWHNITSSTSSGSAQVQGFFQRLPGEILHFLESLPGDMLRIGENIILGLIHGIENQASALLHDVTSLAHNVVSFFTDPFNMGSPSRLMYGHGWNIVQGAINGVQANAPHLLAAMRGLGTGAASAGLGTAALGPGSGGSMHVTVPVTVQGVAGAGSPQYTQGLQAAVQEAVLRFHQLNPTNGFTPSWGR